jgi:hypothetical protein
MTGKLIYVHTTSQSIVFKKYTLIRWHEIDLHIDISVYTGDYNDGKLIYVHATSQSIVFKRISGLIRWRGVFFDWKLVDRAPLGSGPLPVAPLVRESSNAVASLLGSLVVGGGDICGRVVVYFRRFFFSLTGRITPSLRRGYPGGAATAARGVLT